MGLSGFKKLVNHLSHFLGVKFKETMSTAGAIARTTDEAEAMEFTNCRSVVDFNSHTTGTFHFRLKIGNKKERW